MRLQQSLHDSKEKPSNRVFGLQQVPGGHRGGDNNARRVLWPICGCLHSVFLFIASGMCLQLQQVVLLGSISTDGTASLIPCSHISMQMVCGLGRKLPEMHNEFGDKQSKLRVSGVSSPFSSQITLQAYNFQYKRQLRETSTQCPTEKNRDTF